MRATSATGSSPPRTPPSGREWRGFTLVEVMVALAIMVLLAASLPLVIQRATPTRRVAAASERLITDVQLLRARATASGRTAHVASLPGGYRLSSDAGNKDVRLPGSMRLRLSAQGEERTMSEVALYPDGTSSGARFELVDSGRRAVVELSMMTGRVRRSS